MPTFNTALIGQTEKTLNAILDRELAGTGITEPQWVALVLTATSDDSIARDQLLQRLEGALHVSEAGAQELLTGLGELVNDGPTVALTQAGRKVYERIRASVVEITDRLWGDLPAQDLEAAGRVLETVLERARAEVARV